MNERRLFDNRERRLTLCQSAAPHEEKGDTCGTRREGSALYEITFSREFHHTSFIDALRPFRVNDRFFCAFGTVYSIIENQL